MLRKINLHTHKTFKEIFGFFEDNKCSNVQCIFMCKRVAPRKEPRKRTKHCQGKCWFLHLYTRVKKKNSALDVQEVPRDEDKNSCVCCGTIWHRWRNSDDAEKKRHLSWQYRWGVAHIKKSTRNTRFFPRLPSGPEKTPRMRKREKQLLLRLLIYKVYTKKHLCAKQRKKTFSCQTKKIEISC